MQVAATINMSCVKVKGEYKTEKASYVGVISMMSHRRWSQSQTSSSLLFISPSILELFTHVMSEVFVMRAKH